MFEYNFSNNLTYIHQLYEKMVQQIINLTFICTNKYPTTGKQPTSTELSTASNYSTATFIIHHSFFLSASNHRIHFN